MKREIKFRAWDKKDNCMVDWGTMRQSAFNRGDTQFMYDIFTGRLNVELMQYTGLKDKNGKEIYEGDILRPDIHIVTVVYTVESASFNLKTMKKGLMGMAGVNSILEIIGNIYENPELIEVRDIEIDTPQSEVEAEKTLRFLKTGRQHD